MKTWKLSEAQRCLGELVRQAERCGPQQVTGPDGDVVVVSAADYERLLAGSDGPVPDLCTSGDAGGEPVSFLEFMQRSPLAEAIRAGEIDLERYPDWPRGL